MNNLQIIVQVPEDFEGTVNDALDEITELLESGYYEVLACSALTLPFEPKLEAI